MVAFIEVLILFACFATIVIGIVALAYIYEYVTDTRSPLAKLLTKAYNYALNLSRKNRR